MHWKWNFSANTVPAEIRNSAFASKRHLEVFSFKFPVSSAPLKSSRWTEIISSVFGRKKRAVLRVWERLSFFQVAKKMGTPRGGKRGQFGAVAPKKGGTWKFRFGAGRPGRKMAIFSFRMWAAEKEETTQCERMDLFTQVSLSRHGPVPVVATVRFADVWQWGHSPDRWPGGKNASIHKNWTLSAPDVESSRSCCARKGGKNTQKRSRELRVCALNTLTKELVGTRAAAFRRCTHSHVHRRIDARTVGPRRNAVLSSK